MAQSVLIIADSGTGKSTSIRHLNPDETFVINIATSCILSGLPTLVPPNFIIFIITGSFAIEQTFKSKTIFQRVKLPHNHPLSKKKGICLILLSDTILIQDCIFRLRFLNR